MRFISIENGWQLVPARCKQVQQKWLDVSKTADGIYFYGFQFKKGKRIMDKLVISK
jgi:hypothetical protein